MITPKAYATSLANDLAKITMTEFFKQIHSQFYQDQDISFMEYFLELTEHKGEFIVHHDKLREYGIMTSTESSKVKEKLNNLRMVNGRNYAVADVRELRKQGGTSISKHYYLTPQAFKKCLMRAQHRSDQPVDPVIYCDYYELLEEVYNLYTLYERLYSEKLLSMKDSKIDSLSADIKELKRMNQELLGHTLEIKSTAKRTEAYAKQTYKTMNAFLGLFVETGTSNSLFKNILSRHDAAMSTAIENRWYPGVLRMKLLAFIGFYSGNTIYIYSIARNLSSSYFDRLRQLYSKHRTMTMFAPRVISLIGCDVNEESTMITNGEFYDGEFDKKFKRITIQTTHELTYSEARNIFNEGVFKARDHRFHNYQNVIDGHLNGNDVDERSNLAISKINDYDHEFHLNARKQLSRFALSKVIQHATKDGYVFSGTKDRARIIREDILDEDGSPMLMNKREYSLAKLYEVLQDHDIVQYIRDLKDDGLISDDDLELLN